MPLRDKALASILSGIKSQTKADESISGTLLKIIDDYCMSHQFEKYLEDNCDNIASFLASNSHYRKGLWRASQAGECMQQQAYTATAAMEGRIANVVKRQPRTIRALYNGTFMHLRYHMIFDALDDLDIVKTIWAEHLLNRSDLELSGTVDRVVEFEFNGKTVRAVVDFKSIKSRDFDELIEPKHEHALQQHCYHLLDFEATHWVMLYENKDNHEIKMFDREYDPLMTKALVEKYDLLNLYYKTVAMGVPHSERPVLPLKTAWCTYCEWNDHCLKEHPERALPT